MNWLKALEEKVLNEIKMEVGNVIFDRATDGLISEEEAERNSKKVYAKLANDEKFLTEICDEIVNNLDRDAFSNIVGDLVDDAIEQIEINQCEFKKGQRYAIAPSDGFLGIEEGIVQVIRIADYEDVCEEYADPEAIVDGFPELKLSNWIVYKYINGNQKGERYCLDEETFADHVKA